MKSGTGRGSGLHAGDGALLRLLDGEGPAAERAGVSAHVGGCERCRARLERLRRDRETFFDALDAAEPALPSPPRLPTPRTAAVAASTDEAGRRSAAVGSSRLGRTSVPAWRSGWLRAAAVALVAAIGLSAAPPARAWVAAGWQRVAEAIVEPLARAAAGSPDSAAEADAELASDLAGAGAAEKPSSEAAPPTAAELLPPPDAITVGFLPEDGRFRIEIEQPQPGAVLVLRVAASSSAWIEVRGGGRQGIMVRRDGIVIAGGDAEDTRYELTLPPTVREVAVTLAGQPVARIRTAASPLPLVRAFDLSGTR